MSYWSEWAARNPDKVKAHGIKTRALLRRKVRAILGNKCNSCGYTDYRVLHVDHINGGGNVERRALGSTGVYRKVLQDPTPYQLLCANCNAIKAYHKEEPQWN